MNRREMFSAIGAAIAQRSVSGPGFRVQVATTVNATDARTVEEAREAAAMFLWMRLVERFIDPKTKVASFARMRESFLRDVKSWSSV